MKYFVTFLTKGSGFEAVEKSAFITTDDLEKYWFDYIQNKPSSDVCRLLTVTPLPEPPTK